MLPVSLVVWYVFLDYHFQGNIPFVTFKGQWISKYPFGVTKLTKKTNENFVDFCPSLLKEVKSKNKGTLYNYYNFIRIQRFENFTD